MALSEAMNELLGILEKKDPDSAKQLRAVAEKHTEVNEYGLRQSDYSRYLNENAQKIKDAEDGKKKNVEWWDKNKPIFDTAVKERDEARAEAEQFKKEVEEKAAALADASKATVDGKFSAAELAEQVYKRLGDKIPTKDDLATIMQQEAKKQTDAARDEFFNTTFPRAAKWQSELTDAQISYYAETGKRMDSKDFSKFMNDNKIESPASAYERYMAPARTNKEIEAKAEERAQAILKERGATGVPGSSGAPSAPGHLQVRLKERKDNDPLFAKDVELGDGSLAAMAAAELAAEGK